MNFNFYKRNRIVIKNINNNHYYLKTVPEFYSTTRYEFEFLLTQLKNEIEIEN